jgi:hypothetical protein
MVKDLGTITKEEIEEMEQDNERNLILLRNRLGKQSSPSKKTKTILKISNRMNLMELYSQYKDFLQMRGYLEKIREKYLGPISEENMDKAFSFLEEEMNSIRKNINGYLI